MEELGLGYPLTEEDVSEVEGEENTENAENKDGVVEITSEAPEDSNVENIAGE